MDIDAQYEAVKEVIKSRKTEKVLCEPETAQAVPAQLRDKYLPIIRDALETAGWAPFHYPRNVDRIAEPWRAHILSDQQTQTLAEYLKTELNISTKEPLLCAGCHALVVVTWIPEFHDPERSTQSSVAPEAQRIRDEEHLAAASAMVQNFLLLLTAQNLGTYWSSGGLLKSPELLEKIGAKEDERFLAGVFIEYPEIKDSSKDRKQGALRNKRSSQWISESKFV